MGAAGPSARAVTGHAERDPRIRLVEVDASLTRGILAAQAQDTFALAFGNVPARHGIIGQGDVLNISIWEAPPAVLFASGVNSTFVPGASSVALSTNIPDQMVDAEGFITVPFAGNIRAVGRTPNDVAREISSRLSGKAHLPQAMVRIAQNQGAEVTVVGEVAASRRMPLTTKNERLLDALASSGGVRQPVDKVLIQITRGDTVVSRPLAAVIRDPGENILLSKGDVITALFQPYSFQAMGAVNSPVEVNFEAIGITLAQGLARVGGLQDHRANIKGLFIFRFENPAALPPEVTAGATLTPEGRVPVIYRIDMSKPSTFFVMQSFPMRDKDILYVSNAPMADLQKFVTLVSQVAFSISGVASAVE
jgi:polysaccharide export outer membrane protein